MASTAIVPLWTLTVKTGAASSAEIVALSSSCRPSSPACITASVTPVSASGAASSSASSSPSSGCSTASVTAISAVMR